MLSGKPLLSSRQILSLFLAVVQLYVTEDLQSSKSKILEVALDFSHRILGLPEMHVIISKLLLLSHNRDRLADGQSQPVSTTLPQFDHVTSKRTVFRTTCKKHLFSFENDHVDIIASAMYELERHTCLRFEAADEHSFRPLEINRGDQCWSYVGKTWYEPQLVRFWWLLACLDIRDRASEEFLTRCLSNEKLQQFTPVVFVPS